MGAEGVLGGYEVVRVGRHGCVHRAGDRRIRVCAKGRIRLTVGSTALGCACAILGDCTPVQRLYGGPVGPSRR